MGLVEIAEISLGADPRLEGAYVDMPKVGHRTETAALDIAGWVLPADGPLDAVELVRERDVLKSVPANRERPDIASAFPSGHDPLRSGFFTTVAMTGRQPRCELVVRAVVRKHAERVVVATILANRVWREAAGPEALVSVVIPCYRQAHYLHEAIESVLTQSHGNVEIVVIDDGSPDNTGEVAKRYPGVRCVRQENQGLAAARNTGIRSTNGGFLVFLDADDKLLPNALADGVASLTEHPEAAFTAGRCENITASGEVIPGSQQPRRPGGDLLEAQLLDRFVWAGSTVMYRRSLFEFVEPFDIQNSPSGDYDLYLRVMRDHPVAAHEAVVAQYRKHGTAMTRDPGLMLATTAQTLRAHRDYFRADPSLSDAYRRALRRWREYYSLPLADQIRADLHGRHWNRSWSGFRTLLRHDPRRVSAVFGTKAAVLVGTWPEEVESDASFPSKPAEVSSALPSQPGPLDGSGNAVAAASENDDNGVRT